MSESLHSKVLIIGAGPAGYTAAIYAARANLAPLQVMGLQPGGQLMITTDVENYPGFADPIQGPWLMEQMEGQARHVGVDLKHDIITSVDLSARPFRAVGDSGTTYTGDTVIIATGAQARWLGRTCYMGVPDQIQRCASAAGLGLFTKTPSRMNSQGVPDMGNSPPRGSRICSKPGQGDSEPGKVRWIVRLRRP